jgi:hypothetical protein
MERKLVTMSEPLKPVVRQVREVDTVLEDRLGLPRVARMATRKNEAAFYGAMCLLAEQAGIRYFDSDPAYLWLHGVKLPPLPTDPEMLLGFFCHRPYERIFVRDTECAEILGKHGMVSEVMGMPFVYAMGQKVTRREGSLLIVPAHSLKNTEHDWPFEAFAEQMAAIKPRFKEVVACIHPACWEKGYWIGELEKVGIPCVRGADSYDANALKRMAVLFESFETVMTNVWGSHIPYAAACGARVCLQGEYLGFRREEFEHLPAYQDRPKVLEQLGKRGREFYLNQLPWLDAPPDQAVTQMEWGRELIGCQHKRTAIEIRKILGWGWRTEWQGWWRSKRKK